MSINQHTPLTWHQRPARTITFGALPVLVILGPYIAASYLISVIGY